MGEHRFNPVALAAKTGQPIPPRNGALELRQKRIPLYPGIRIDCPKNEKFAVFMLGDVNNHAVAGIALDAPHLRKLAADLIKHAEYLEKAFPPVIIPGGIPGVGTEKTDG